MTALRARQLQPVHSHEKQHNFLLINFLSLSTVFNIFWPHRISSMRIVPPSFCTWACSSYLQFFLTVFSASFISNCCFSTLVKKWNGLGWPPWFFTNPMWVFTVISSFPIVFSFILISTENCDGALHCFWLFSWVIWNHSSLSILGQYHGNT